MLNLKIATPVAAACAAMLLASCGGGGGGGGGAPVETVAPAATAVQSLQNARYVVKMTDSVTGATVTDPLKVTFVGAAALKAADGSSLNGKTVTVTDGIVFVNAEFTTGAQDFSVQVADAASAGWVATGTRVVGAPGLVGDQPVELKMVNTTKAASINSSDVPVAMAVASGSATSTGAFAAPVALATTPKPVTNAEGATETIGTSKLEIPVGTVGRTASGAVAAPGPLTVSNTYFGNANSDSLQAFPGGFAATVEVPAANASVLNGNAADAGTFVTAGFAQFNVTDSKGNAIKNFDKPLTVGIDLPKTTQNEAGVTLKVGDQYPVWSYDDTTGKWVFEKMGTVAEKSPVDPDNFTVQFQTTHLSSWNLDQYVNSCTANVNITGRPAGDARPLEVQIVGATGQRYGYGIRVTDSNVTLMRAPRIGATITVLDRGTVVGRATTKNLCGGAVPLPVTLTPIATGSVSVETYEACADGSQQRAVPTSVFMYFSRNSAGTWSEYKSLYTSTVAGTVAQTTANSIPVGAVLMYAWDPRASRWIQPAESVTRNGTNITSSDVTANQTTVFRYRFTMPCKVVTGGSGG